MRASGQHATARFASRAVALAAASALALSSCASLPQGPPPLPSTFIPQVTPSNTPLAAGVFEGFTALERVAMRVRVRTCTQYQTGTAWVLDEHHAVTNRHVVKGATNIELTSFDGHAYTGTASVLDPTADLALITVKESFPEIATVADTEPAVGDVLKIAGYPQGQVLAVSEGPFVARVGDTVESMKDKVYEVEAQSRHGSSGSPVANAEGQITGVLYASDDRNMSLVIALPTLKDFLTHLDGATRNTANCPAQG